VTKDKRWKVQARDAFVAGRRMAGSVDMLLAFSLTLGSRASVRFGFPGSSFIRYSPFATEEKRGSKAVLLPARVGAVPQREEPYW
jgi:hypothetical protein